MRVTNTFLPLLQQSARPRLVMVSSGMGSFGITLDRARLESTLWGIVYPSSKAALNMVTTMYAKSLPDVRVTAVDPGYTATDLNGFSGTQTVDRGRRADRGGVRRRGAARPVHRQERCCWKRCVKSTGRQALQSHR